MLTETFFGISEQARIGENNKRLRKITLLMMIIGIPLELLMGYFAAKKSPINWIIPIVGVITLVSAYYFGFRKGLRLSKQDLNEQVKLVGELQVASKSGKDKYWLIGFDSIDLGNILVPQGVYDKINIGDTLHIEISKYTHYIFKLSNNDEILISGV